MRFGLRELIFVLVILAMPVAAYFLWFQRRNADIEAMNADIMSKREKLRELDQAASPYVDLEEQISSLAKTIDDFEQRLPSDPREFSVVGDVTDIARKHQLDVRLVKPDKLVKAARYLEKPIRMEIVGDFDDFYSFLLDVNQMPRITQLPQMRLRRLDNEGDGTLEATLTLSIFFDGPTETAVQ